MAGMIELNRMTRITGMPRMWTEMMEMTRMAGTTKMTKMTGDN